MDSELKKFINASMDAVVIVDGDQKIICFNHPAEKIFGYTSSEILGKKLDVLIPSQYRDLHKGYVNKFGDDKSTTRMMGREMYVRGLHADGSELTLEISITAYSHNEKQYYVGIVRDYTAKYKIESELQLLSVAVEQSSASIIITDAEGTIEYVNKGFTETTGYTLEEARGQNPRILKSGLTPADTFKELWNTIKSGNRWSGTFINKKKTGEHYWQQATLSPIFNKSGELTNFVGVIEDISHRKLKEEILRANEQRYRVFFEDDVSGAYIARPDGTIIACNKAFRKIFGVEDLSENQSFTLQSFYPSKEEWNSTLALLKKERKLDNIHKKLHTFSGNGIHVVENLVGSFNEQDEIVEINGYLINETRLKALEHQLLQAQKMESIGTLAAGVAHDFNNVLAIILNASEILRLEFPDKPEYLKYIDIIAQSAKRGSSIAKEMLLFSRHDVAKLGPVSLNKSIPRILNFLEHSLPKSVAIEFQQPDQRNFEIFGDYALIEQIYLNLSINAADAMPRGGTLTLGMRTADAELLRQKYSDVQNASYVELYFSDTGEGMEQAMIERIFDPFYTTKSPDKGTGLGLSIVHGIVTSLKGLIDVESGRGKGTTFRVYLPLAQTSQHVEKEKKAVIHEPHGETILVVDDEQEILDLICDVLSIYGYKTLPALDVDTALEKLKVSPETISAVITDLAMPHKNGDELVQTVHLLYPEKKIIVMTGFNNPDIAARLKALGCDAFLQKPTEIDILLDTLDQLLSSESRFQ